MKASRRKLEDQAKLVEVRIDHNQKVARELITQQKKDRALLALKKKKINEHQLKQIQAWLLNVEDMLSNVESTKQQNKVLAVLKQGNDVLKDIQKEFTVEDVQKLMDDTAEAKALQDELSEILGQSLTDADEDEVLAELDALEAAVLPADAEEVQKLPSAPTTKVEVPVTPAEVAEGDSAAMEEEAAGELEAERPERVLVAA